MHLVNKNEQLVTIPGPVGQLETLLSGFENIHAMSSVGIFCHPHPLYQGTMHNKVVTTVIRAWQALNFSTVRFNFRGVGASAGIFDQGIGETQDLKAVLEWVRLRAPKAKLWLGGFSFGAGVALRIMNSSIELAGMISIAPALQYFEDLDCTKIKSPWLIVHGEEDELVPLILLNPWLNTLRRELKDNKDLEIDILPHASHFFHGRLSDLKLRVQSFVHKHCQSD